MADGTIEKRVNAKGKVSWQARLDCGKLPDGKRDRWIRNYDTKRDATTALQAKREEVRTGKYRPATTVTVAQCMESWLAGKHGTISDRSLINYRDWTARHITPKIGTIPVERLTPTQIEKWRDGLSLGGLSPRYVNAHLGLLKQALERAVLVDQILAENPAERVAWLRVRTKDKAHWSMEEVQRFLEAARDDRHYALFLVAITTGMRRGEILGLRWHNVDIERGTIRVVEARSMRGYRPVMAETKSAAGNRTVMLDSVTKAALMDLAVKRSAQREVHGYIESGHVFLGKTGKPLHPIVFSKYFQQFLVEHQLPVVTFHSLRSTAITLALTVTGGNIKVVSERMGHSQTRTTLGVYAYSFKHVDALIADGVGKLLFGEESQEKEGE